MRQRFFPAIVLIVLLSFSPVQTSHSEELVVDLDTIIQDNFLGINAVYHGFTYMPESVEMGMNEEFRKIEMDRVKTSGLHIARTFYRPDWAMGQGPWVKPDWNSEKMQALYNWLADMKSLKVDVALNMGWWFGRDVIWNSDQHLPSYPEDRDNFVRWASESLHQIIELRGFDNVKYIFMFTEPGGNYGDIPHGKKTWEYYKEVVIATHNQLVTDGRRSLVKIIGPNTTQAPRWLDEAVDELNSVIDIYASHNYNFTTYDDWYKVALSVKGATKDSGRPFWIDEYGVQDFGLRKSGAYGTILALANVAFLNAGAQSTLLWIYNDQYYPYPLKHITNGDAFLDGKHSWGLFPWLPESREVRPAWHAFTMMSRLMGGKETKVHKTEGGKHVQVAAVSSLGQGVSILTVNSADTAQDVQIHLTRSINGDMYRYLFDPADLKPKVDGSFPVSDKQFASVANEIRDNLPAKAVAVYSTSVLETEIQGLREKRTLFDTPSEKNLAFRKKVEASSSDPDWPPEYVTDGKRLLYWSSKPKGMDHPEEVRVDLGDAYTLHQVDIYPRYGDNIFQAECFPIDYDVSLSIDKKSWNPVFERKREGAQKTGVQSISFPPLSARYVRLQGKSLSGCKVGYAMQISEIKVFGK